MVMTKGPVSASLYIQQSTKAPQHQDDLHESTRICSSLTHRRHTCIDLGRGGPSRRQQQVSLSRSTGQRTDRGETTASAGGSAHGLETGCRLQQSHRSERTCVRRVRPISVSSVSAGRVATHIGRLRSLHVSKSTKRRECKKYKMCMARLLAGSTMCAHKVKPGPTHSHKRRQPEANFNPSAIVIGTRDHQHVANPPATTPGLDTQANLSYMSVLQKHCT